MLYVRRKINKELLISALPGHHLVLDRRRHGENGRWSTSRIPSRAACGTTAYVSRPAWAARAERQTQVAALLKRPPPPTRGRRSLPLQATASLSAANSRHSENRKALRALLQARECQAWRYLKPRGRQMGTDRLVVITLANSQTASAKSKIIRRQACRGRGGLVGGSRTGRASWSALQRISVGLSRSLLRSPLLSRGSFAAELFTHCDYDHYQSAS